MWLPVFDHLKSWAASNARLVKLGAAIVIGAVLLAPSLWMLMVIPPLWRGADAYVQLTYPPNLQTIVLFGPPYCFGARIPLYIGYAIESLRAGKPFPTPGFFIRPTLNDSGVFLLLLSQHVAFFCSAFYFIVLTSRLFWVRLTLAAMWASNPLFYTFAHCVGNEALSMVLLLLAGAIGLTIVQHARDVGWKRWLLFGVLLWLSILTRHINAVLAAVLPLTFLFLCGYRLTTIPLSRSQLLGRWRRLRMRQELKTATVAVAIGIISIALASVSLRGLCRIADTPYYSTLGYTFLFRLQFLAALSAKERNQLLDQLARNNSSELLKAVIPPLREAFSKPPERWEIDSIPPNLGETEGTMIQQAPPLKQLMHETFPDGSAVGDVLAFQRKVGQLFKGSAMIAFDHIARTFLYHPSKPYLTAVRKDFTRSQQITVPMVVDFVFLSTTAYFVAPSFMPEYARLVTFRDKSPMQIVRILKTHSYFHFWRSVNHAAVLCFWAANLALLMVLVYMRNKDVAALALYAVALVLVGLLMMLANCLLVDFIARYALPMWELTIASASLLFGKTIESLFSPGRRLATP
jgi:hypothetical protein